MASRYNSNSKVQLLRREIYNRRSGNTKLKSKAGFRKYQLALAIIEALRGQMRTVGAVSEKSTNPSYTEPNPAITGVKNNHYCFSLDGQEYFYNTDLQIFIVESKEKSPEFRRCLEGPARPSDGLVLKALPYFLKLYKILKPLDQSAKHSNFL